MRGILWSGFHDLLKGFWLVFSGIRGYPCPWRAAPCRVGPYKPRTSGNDQACVGALEWLPVGQFNPGPPKIKTRPQCIKNCESLNVGLPWSNQPLK